MPTTRTPIARGTKSQITDEVISVYRRLREIYDLDLEDKWEEDGGRRREYLDASAALDHMLKIKPWEASLTSTFGYEADDEPPYWENHPKAWRRVRDVRLKLDEILNGEPT